jgi:lysophospholipase L1-like esterase
MGTRRLGCALAGLVALCCVASGCSSSRSASSEGSSTTTATAPETSSLVALGDSVPRGTNCHCTPYPPLTAEQLTASSGRTLDTANDAVAGATTSTVLRQLASDGAVIDHVRRADVIEIEIGANDVAYNSDCGTAVDCYAAEIPTIRKNLDEIVARVHALTSGREALVVLLDYWSVWLGGKYAAAKGEAYVAAAEQVTDDVNAVIESTAARSRSPYVDLRAAFKGPDYAYDETHYLAPDGDHPNAAGHKQIATAAATVIEKALHI